MTALSLHEAALTVFESCISAASDTARRYGSSRLKPSHLLYALLQHDKAMSLLADDGYDPDLVCMNLVSILQKGQQPELETAPPPSIEFATAIRNARLLVEATHFSEDAQKPERFVLRALLNAVMRHADKDDDCLTVLSIMSAQCAPEDIEENRQRAFIEETIRDIEEEELNFISGTSLAAEEGFSKDEGKSDIATESGAPESEEGPPTFSGPKYTGGRARPNANSQSQLAKDAVEVEAAVARAFRDLTEAASLGQLDPVINRDDELEKILDAMQRRRKRSVILHGPAGVGKTAIAEGIAHALRAPNAPCSLADRKVYELSMSALVAGARYRGDFEERMERALTRIQHEGAIVFIDEIHTLMGLGASQSRGMDAPNILKPALARGDVIIIGATTTEELPAIMADKAIMRRFELLEIREPDADMMLDILDRAGQHYLSHHGVEADLEVFQEIIDTCAAYIPTNCFPDKAFDILDRACIEAVKAKSDTITSVHVRRAAINAGALIPEPPTALMKRACKKALERLEACGSLQKDISRLKESLSMRMLVPALCSGTLTWVFMGSQESCVTAVKDLARALGRREALFPGARLADYSAGDWLSGSGVMRTNGALIEALDLGPDSLLVFESADEAHISALKLIRQIAEQGGLKASDGRYVSSRRAISVLTMRKPEGGSIGFRTQDQSPIPAHMQELIDVPGVILVDVDTEYQAQSESSVVSEIIEGMRNTGFRAKIDASLAAAIDQLAREEPLRISALKADIIAQMVCKITTEPHLANMRPTFFPDQTSQGRQLRVTVAAPKLAAPTG